jgi:Tol biopolymer transport system component
MKQSHGIALVTSAAALSAALILFPATGRSQAPTAEEKAKTKAKAIAQAFEQNARVLTLFDRDGKTVATIGDRAIYNQPVFSPDRSRVAVIKTDLAGEAADLYVMDVASGKAIRLTTSKPRDQARAPAWSPDGKQVAYVAVRDGREGLYRKAATGEGNEELLVALPGAGIQLTDWSVDGRYLSYFSSQLGESILYGLPLEGERKPVELHRSKFQVLGARISPDNRFIAYRSNETGKSEVFVRAFNPTGAALSAEASKQWMVSNNEGGLGLVFWKQDATELLYMGADRGVKSVSVSTAPAFEFGKPRTLFNLPDSIPVNGTPGGLGNIARDGQRVVFAIPPAPLTRSITIYDRQGKALRTVGEPGLYNQPAISPDGTRIAVMRNDNKTGLLDIWSFDVATGKGTNVTNDREVENAPIWAGDGKQLAYVSTRGNYSAIYRKAADGSGSEEQLFQYTPGAGILLTDWSSDGKYLTFCTGVQVVVPLSDRKAIDYLREEYGVCGGRFSPDGKLFAYGSDEAVPDVLDVYVRQFDLTPNAPVKVARVSAKGSKGMILWRQDGKEIYFLDTDDNVMAADVTTTPTLQVGTPRRLFKVPVEVFGNPLQMKNVSADGQQFVFLAPVR